MTKIEIKHRFTDSVLFSHEVENNTIKITLLAAFAAGANLRGAYLEGANLLHYVFPTTDCFVPCCYRSSIK